MAVKLKAWDGKRKTSPAEVVLAASVIAEPFPTCYSGEACVNSKVGGEAPPVYTG